MISPSTAHREVGGALSFFIVDLKSIFVSKDTRMITLTQDIPDFSLQSGLPALQCTTTRQSVSVVLKRNSVIILQETFYPDASGAVALYGLAALLDPYFDAPLQQFTYILTDTDGYTSKTFTVLQARILIAQSSFVQAFFLSALAGRPKQTAQGRREYLHLTGGTLTASKNVAVSAEISLISDAGKLVTDTIQIGSYPLQGVVKVDVSPERFVREGHTLIAYTVVCEARRQPYLVLPSGGDDPCLIFKNAFGVDETFYFSGVPEVSSEFTRSEVVIRGVTRLAENSEVRTYKFNSGALSEGLCFLARDLMAAKEVRWLTADGELPVVVTECESEERQDGYSLNYLSVSCKLADPCQAYLPLPVQQIFDNSFDNSFE